MTKTDALVIGGGFYGALVALMLRERGREVTLVEESAVLLGRASERNQARVHGGYHYPRSLMTALRSRVNYPRFIQDFADCIYDRFEHLYAVAQQFSKVSARQFRLFMGRIGSPLRRAPDRLAALFRSSMIEESWIVEECAFNAAVLRDMVQERLDRAGVRIMMQTRAESAAADGDRVAVQTSCGGGTEEWHARRVFDCTYGKLNRLRARAGWKLIPLKHELAEMCLVEVPEELQATGFTVMCGPFFSLMPYPARGALRTLSHVRYTPHLAWTESTAAWDWSAEEIVAAQRRESACVLMQRDAARYLPAIAACRYVESIWEVKTVLPQNEGDDGRPILFNSAPECPRFISVMGGKLDNIYDLPQALAQLPD